MMLKTTASHSKSRRRTKPANHHLSQVSIAGEPGTEGGRDSRAEGGREALGGREEEGEKGRKAREGRSGEWGGRAGGQEGGTPGGRTRDLGVREGRSL